jgi:hypothetical protein
LLLVVCCVWGSITSLLMDSEFLDNEKKLQGGKKSSGHSF